MSNVIQSGLPDATEQGSGGDFQVNNISNLTDKDSGASVTGAPADEISSPVYLRMSNPSSLIPTGSTITRMGFQLEHNNGADSEWAGAAWHKDYDVGNWIDITDNHNALGTTSFTIDDGVWTSYSALNEVGAAGYNLTISPDDVINLWNNGELGLAFTLECISRSGQVGANNSVQVRNFEIQIEYEDPVSRRRILLTQIL